MKKTDKHIDNMVNETLKAFDGVERAKPKPFLYTRIKARMEREDGAPVRSGVLSPAFQQVILGFVILVLAVNIYTTSRLFAGTPSTESVQSEEQAFVEELYPSTPTLYTINQTTTNP